MTSPALCKPLRDLCRDAWRRVAADHEGNPEPALFPLAHGVFNRVGTLRGAGDAIVPQVAAQFVTAYTEARV